ncbi:MAG: glycosyltransferase [Pirellulales bacterium]
MRIAMLDPSAFTIPYDAHLCRALAQAGSVVEFYTRPARKLDYFPKSVYDSTIVGEQSYDTVEHFYRVSEQFFLVAKFPLLKMGIKGVEHALNMVSLIQKLRRFRPDAIHMQWLVIPGLDRHFVRRLRKLAPVILTVHDIKACLSPSNRLQTAGWTSALAEFDGLIVHTKIGKQSLVSEGIKDSKISIVPHGVFDMSLNNKHAEGRSSHSETWNLLAFGAIKPYKGLDVLIRALAELPKLVRSKVRLIIAGNPCVSARQLRSLAVECGVDDCIEWILRFIKDDEVPELFHRSDVVVFPYKSIDASGVLMTALPYGKTIVASRLGLFNEIFQDGETAMLVEPDNPFELAAALATIYENPVWARKMGHRSAELAKDVCSWDRIAKQTIAVYRRVTKECM